MDSSKKETKSSKKKIVFIIFTLILMLIVWAIVMPAYNSYQKRNDFVDIIAATAAAKTQAEVCGQTKNTFLTSACTSLAPSRFNVPAEIVLSFPKQNSSEIVIKATRGDEFYSVSGVLADGVVTWSKKCEPTTYCS